MPVEICVVAAPNVNFGLANLTMEAATRLFNPMLLNSLVTRAALRADEYYGDWWAHSQTRIGARCGTAIGPLRASGRI